ncbi:hypothetical protein B0H10DRAFT_2208582 [Mycena sp. CBHHK59/15]|nr:hypothetical protein B0H10DRAFT_2208582 [Mycena sp. CBHHK59/15]
MAPHTNETTVQYHARLLALSDAEAEAQLSDGDYDARDEARKMACKAKKEAEAERRRIAQEEAARLAREEEAARKAEEKAEAARSAATSKAAGKRKAAAPEESGDDTAGPSKRPRKEKEGAEGDEFSQKCAACAKDGAHTFTATSAPNVLEYNKATFLIKIHPSTEHFLRQIMTKILKALHHDHTPQLPHHDTPHCRVLESRAHAPPHPQDGVHIVNSAAMKVFTTLVKLTEVLRSSAHPPLWHIHIYLYMWKWSKDMSDILAPVLTPLRQLLSVCHLHGMLLNVLEIDKQLVSLEMDKDMWEALFGTGGEFYSEW